MVDGVLVQVLDGEQHTLLKPAPMASAMDMVQTITMAIMPTMVQGPTLELDRGRRLLVPMELEERTELAEVTLPMLRVDLEDTHTVMDTVWTEMDKDRDRSP